MNLAAARRRLDHDAFRTTAATILGYGLMVLAVFAVLFVLPWLAISAL